GTTRSQEPSDLPGHFRRTWTVLHNQWLPMNPCSSTLAICSPNLPGGNRWDLTSCGPSLSVHCSSSIPLADLPSLTHLPRFPFLLGMLMTFGRSPSVPMDDCWHPGLQTAR